MSGPLDEHYCYLADRVKVERYKAAIERAVRPGQLVMDLGCGSGLLGLIALYAGADKVLFVEKDPIIGVARRTVIEAGFGERADFYHTSSYELRLIDRVDVIICDHVGYFGIDYGILALLADARHRFLDHKGMIVPARIDLMLAPAETAIGRELVSRWTNGSISPDYRARRESRRILALANGL
jgi:protein arginine N-methyltransferase 1